jgi:hypothetical protein
MSGLPRVDASSTVVIHTLPSTTQSEGRIHTQKSTTTTEKVSDVVECIICCDEGITEQTPQLIHRTNKDCDLYKNKQVCYICISKLERCPFCRENLTTGEMQQNNLQRQDQLAPIAQNQQPFIININVNMQNLNPAQEQRYRCSHVHFIKSGALVVSLIALGFFGWLAVTAIRDHTA